MNLTTPDIRSLSRERLSTRGFTLMEILITIAIIAVVATIASVGATRMREKAKKAVDITKMREIGHSILARGMGNNGTLYTKAEVGSSLYRQWDDPLSLCQILDREDYLPAENTWIGPMANDRHLKYKNSYIWPVNEKITVNFTMVEEPQTKMILMNNYPYTLPSVKNVPESPNGPRPASAQYRRFPWNGGTKYHAFMLDGHIALKP